MTDDRVHLKAEVVREIRDDVRNRVEALIASLGLDVAATGGQQ